MHACDRPVARRDACRYFMARREPSLPIQNDRAVVAPGIGEADIKKHLWFQIGTGDLDGVRRPWSNNRTIELEAFHDRARYQRRRNVKFGAADRRKPGV